MGPTDPNDSKHVDRLARVRDNQRKSRARRQEYVKELEQRLAACEETAQQKDIAHRLVKQTSEAENRHLRALLKKIGVSKDLIEQYLQHAKTADIEGKIAIPAIQKSTDSSGSRLSVEIPHISTEAEPESITTNRAASNIVKQEEDPAFCGCGDERQVPTSDEDVLNSTLCAIAEEMITQYNTKGVDVEEIRQRIWSGFRAGVDGTGCRVQNHVLFQVLDDISGDV